MNTPPTLDTPLVEVRNLSVPGVLEPRIDQVSVSLVSGQVVVLIGENGAGKTTFLDAIAGMVPLQDHSSVHLKGTALPLFSVKEKASHIASMPQRDEATGALSVERRILQGASAMWGVETLFEEQHAPMLEDLLEEFQLLPLRHRTLDQISGGERRRVHVARCLAHQSASVFLFDEPFAGVDRGQASFILDALKKRAKQGALVVASVHDLDLAATLADRILGFKQGKLVVDGPIEAALNEENLFKLYKKKGRLVDEGGPQQNLFGVLFER